MRLPLAIGAVAIALLLAACSSAATPGPAKQSVKPVASVSPVSSPVVTAPAVTALTGVQLGTALAPASSFPGFTANKKYAYRGGSGTSALPSQFSLATMSCTRFSTQLLFATELL